MSTVWLLAFEIDLAVVFRNFALQPVSLVSPATSASFPQSVCWDVPAEAAIILPNEAALQL